MRLKERKKNVASLRKVYVTSIRKANTASLQKNNVGSLHKGIVAESNIVISVSDNMTIKRGQEIFIVTPSVPKTQFNRIKRMNDVIVRAKVETVDGNLLTLSSVPESRTVVEAKPIIDRCIKRGAPVYVEGIEKW